MDSIGKSVDYHNQAPVKSEASSTQVIHEALFRRFCQLTKSPPENWNHISMSDNGAMWQNVATGRIFSVRF